MSRRNTIGLRHILEGTIKILEGKRVDPSRKKYLLNSVIKLLGEAEKGSNFVHERAWVVPPAESDSLESYSFLTTYFQNGDYLDQNLPSSKKTIMSVASGSSVAAEKLQPVIKLLKELLERMRTERQLYSEEVWDQRFAPIE
jgi:hypothetical protein